MSAKQTNNSPPQKMCKSPKTTDYEVLSTNCTLIGSNNLHLETKLTSAVYQTPKINICSKPMKHTELKKSNTNFGSQQVSNYSHQSTKVYDARTINKFSPISSPLSNGLYSNPSPSYPNNAVSPYNVQISSPASGSSVPGIKSPVASPQQIRPPTPQPILPQAFQQIPVMTSGANLVQIIHNTPGYQNHPVLTRQTIIGAPNQTIQQASPLIKIKPPQNILPKPPATSGAAPQPAKPPQGARTIPQTSVVQNPQLPPNPAQIVLPNQTILPAAQPGTLLLNQMPLIVQQNTAHGGVQLILRPSTPNSSPQLTKNLAPQNLILQQGGSTAAPQVILQHAGGQRGAIQQPQQLVRVLTANGMIQQLAPTYITMNNQLNLQQLTQPAPMNQPTNQPNKILTQNGQHIIQNHQGLIGACLQAPPVNQGAGGAIVAPSPGVVGSMEQLPPPKRKPKKKKKIKEKLDLGSIMKLSGIGDEDDVMFESDNSESTNTDSNPITTQQQQQHPQQQQQQKLITSRSEPNIITSPAITSPLVSSPLITSPLVTSPSENDSKRLQINPNLTQNLTQNLNQVIPDKQPAFAQSQLSVQQSLSDINAINQNLTQIGLIQNNAQNFLNTSNQLIQSQIGNTTLINQDNQNLANFLQTLQNPNFLPTLPGLPKFPQTSTPQTFPNLIASNTENLKKNLLPAHFNIPNIQVQNFPNQNLILNQAPNTILAPNFPGLLQNNLIQNAGNLNFLQTGLVQANTTDQYAGGNVPRMGGFKLALSEDGRLILQHDPNLNQDIQSQLLLQNIFGINLQGGNLVLTSVNAPAPKSDSIQTQQTKTTNIIKNVITSPKPTETQNINQKRPQNTQVMTLNSQATTLNSHGMTLNSQGMTLHSQATTLNSQGMTLHSQATTLNSQCMTLNSQGMTLNSQVATSNSQVMPSNSQIATSNSMVLPSNSMAMPTNSQVATSNSMVIPSNAMAMPSNSMVMSSNSMAMPSNSMVTPSNSMVTPSNSMVTPSNSQVTPPAPYIVNLTPEQLDQLKKNGQVSVNGQIIYMQRQLPKVEVEKTPKSPKNKSKPKKLEKKTPERFESKLNQPNQTLINQLQSPAMTQIIDPKPLTDKPQLLGQKTQCQEKPSGEQDMNVEQFLSNLNINTTNLSQLISQKLSQELPNVDHKILNIQAGPNAGQLVAKIDISSADMTQLLNIESNLSAGENLTQPCVQIKQESEQTHEAPMPALVLTSEAQNDKNTVYQRIQTIQLTPQKQQLLKSVQLQIQALTARLQQKDPKSDKIESNIPENDIQNALRHLYMEQQKILATGKLLPTINQPITSLNCNMDTISTQSGPVISNSLKSNGSYVTSLLQQPVVSSNQPQKIYYHNGNQIITLNSSNILPSPVMTPTVTSSVANQTQPQQQHQQLQTSTSTSTATQTITPQSKLKKSPVPVAMSTSAGATPVKVPVATTSDKGCQMSPNQSNQITIKTEAITTTTTPTTITVATTSTVATSAPNLTSLLSPKPRNTKPTYSKAQLIEQQLQTDQNGANNPDINTPFASKADACKRLVRYHCYNQPVLSEKDLNKADEIFELTARHFIGKFQGMVNKYKYLLLKESMREVPTSELMMIDRMFLAEEQQSFLKLQSDIKLQNDLEEDPAPAEDNDIKPDFQLPDELIDDFVSVKQESESDKSEPAGYEGPTNTDFNIKCGLNYFADESCDSVYESPTNKFDEFIDAHDKSKPEKGKTGGGGGSGESYNTTKIIGNFEIEINNKGCNAQESYTKNFRQKFIDNKPDNRKTEESFEKSEDYDEWLCIQRELGYLSDNPKQEGGKDPGDSSTNPESKSSAQKRNSNENRLETLKKFRVEKHNSKSKKTGSIIGEVKFEVRIEHKKVFAEQNSSKGAAQKRAHYEYQKETNDAAKRQKSEFNSLQIKQEDNYLEENFPELLDATSSDGLIDTSIDEQVQSAIDSILNLQQIASMTEQKDATTTPQPQTVTCRNINTLTNYSKSDAADLVAFSEDTLDDAVKSILS